MEYYGKANKASEEYKMKVAEEKVKLAVLSYQVNQVETTLYEELIKIEGLSEITSSGENKDVPFIVVVDGYKFKVNDNLSIEYLGKENEMTEKLPQITKVEYETEEVLDGLTVSITAKTEDIKGLKELNVYYKKVEGEKVRLEILELQKVIGQEANVMVTIPINGNYVIQAIGENNKIGTKEINITNIKEGSVLASITGGNVTNDATATIKIIGRGQGRTIQKMELFVDGKSAKIYEYTDLNMVREESYTIEELEFYKDMPCYIKTWDSNNEEKISETKTVINAKIIKTATDLRNLATQVNTNNNTFQGKTIQLIADISTGENWIPIGYWDKKSGMDYTGKCFSGTFEGNNHSITINSLSQDTIYKSTGLFGMGIRMYHK